MSILKNRLRWAVFSLLLIASPAFYTRSVSAGEGVEPFDQVKRLGRGVNILGYDPLWKSFEKGRFKERHFKLIRDEGFQTVRINLHALQLLRADNNYKLGDAWLNTLGWAVKNALANDLYDIDNDRWVEPIRQALIP